MGILRLKMGTSETQTLCILSLRSTHLQPHNTHFESQNTYFESQTYHVSVSEYPF